MWLWHLNISFPTLQQKHCCFVYLLSNFKSHLLLLLINIFQKLHPPRSPQKDSRREDRDQSKSVERNISMAKFTAQGLRLTFNGDRAPFGCELREQVRFSGRRIHDRPASIHKIGRGLRSPPDAAGKVWSLGRRSGSSKAEECVREVMDDDDDDDEYEDDQEREGEEEGEFERDELSCFRGLVLDISYRPVNVVCWKRAICLEFMEKADVLEYYDQTISSPRGSFYIPAVLRVPHLLQVVKRRRIKQQLSRKNILYRDNFICQYCSSRQNLTIDHVLPICRGGEWKWENLVTACASCNSRKGQKTLVEANMKLMKTPKAPKEYDILAIPLTSAAIRMLKIRKGVPEEWLQYLPKQSP